MKFKKINESRYGSIKKLANGCKMRDMGDCFVVTDPNGKNIGQCRSETEAETIAEEYGNSTNETSKKIVKEGAGAGYDIEIKDMKIGDVVSFKMDGDYVVFTAKIAPCRCKVVAAGYYEQYFPLVNIYGDVLSDEYVQIDGGTVTGNFWYGSSNIDELSEDVVKENLPETFSITSMYGRGWTHKYLPEDGHIELKVNDYTNDYVMIYKVEIDSTDMSDSINWGYENHLDIDNDEEEEEDPEEVNESYDDNAKVVNSEDDGDRLYKVGLWWGSGYVLDTYLAYAFSAEEALNHVVAYIEKTHPKWLKESDECAKDMMKEYDEESPEFQETFTYVDATMEGADKPHFIWAENLMIKEA